MRIDYGEDGEEDTWTMERAGYSFQLHSSSHTLGETTMMMVMMIITLKMMVMKMILVLRMIMKMLMQMVDQTFC